MLTKKGYMCSHPELPLYNPNTGERNLPCEVNTCECGQNYCCPKCGYGAMGFPHECKEKTNERVT